MIRFFQRVTYSNLNTALCDCVNKINTISERLRDSRWNVPLINPTKVVGYYKKYASSYLAWRYVGLIFFIMPIRSLSKYEGTPIYFAKRNSVCTDCNNDQTSLLYLLDFASGFGEFDKKRRFTNVLGGVDAKIFE